MKEYDLVVLGSGPAGEKACAKAAYFGHSVALVEKKKLFGGAGVHTGTLPSKTLKETALFFSGKYDRGLYGLERHVTKEISIEDFFYRKNFVISSEGEGVHRNLVQHQVDIFHGAGSFVDPHTILVQDGLHQEHLRGKFILIATGSYPFHPDHLPFDNLQVHDSDTILEIEKFPRSLCILGAGVIGCEYATIFATMGVQVTLINKSSDILSFLDKEISEALVTSMSHEGINLLFNQSVLGIEKTGPLPQDPLKVLLENGESLLAEMFLFAAGRNGNTKTLHCENAGVLIGKREAIEVNDHYQTNIPHIYAAGDVIGFPALASTSMDQGRIAVAHMFDIHDLDALPKIFPYGIYTVPEVSSVGISEEQTREKGLAFCTGKAFHADLPRGKIMGAKDGFLKILFEKESLVILGVHILGPLASELIHYGLSLIENKKTVLHVISTVFNFPTLHDLYKYACYDGLGNLAGHKISIRS